jgi:hypothetical protein
MFVHIRIYEYITDIRVDSVKTGIGNLISNKGAVGMSFYIGNESFMVVSCHLASGQHHVMKRNSDF